MRHMSCSVIYNIVQTRLRTKRACPKTITHTHISTRSAPFSANKHQFPAFPVGRLSHPGERYRALLATHRDVPYAVSVAPESWKPEKAMKNSKRKLN